MPEESSIPSYLILGANTLDLSLGTDSNKRRVIFMRVNVVTVVNRAKPLISLQINEARELAEKLIRKADEAERGSHDAS